MPQPVSRPERYLKRFSFCGGEKNENSAMNLFFFTAGLLSQRKIRWVSLNL